MGIQEWDMYRISLAGRLKCEKYLEARRAAMTQAQGR